MAQAAPPHSAVRQAVVAFFTVEISSPSYQAELYGDVALECRFPPGDGTVPLSVFWGRLQPGQNLVVYNMINGQEDLNSQDFSYRGRVNLKKEELSKGRAVLHISHLRMNDSGRYQCLLEMGSVDYKQTTLTVKGNTEETAKEGDAYEFQGLQSARWQDAGDVSDNMPKGNFDT
ncbi:hypothetical protein Z043_114563 [Scleropages formosus]|uniref:Ig-like domain-containing protein n=1 Tax=Scleropages formosus TaxID=113540 RepID=A0A0P7UYT8_SCLFO|nr:hypothetical protein Z043_114563 [Scleropages formosus]